MSFLIVGDEDWTTDFKVEVNNLLFQNESTEYFETADEACKFIEDHAHDRFIKLFVKFSSEKMKLIQIRVLPDFESDDSFIVQRGSTEGVVCNKSLIAQSVKNLLVVNQNDI